LPPHSKSVRANVDGFGIDEEFLVNKITRVNPNGLSVALGIEGPFFNPIEEYGM
jgi:hypothetical protein